jgi:hypothetical protein
MQKVFFWQKRDSHSGFNGCRRIPKPSLKGGAEIIAMLVPKYICHLRYVYVPLLQDCPGVVHLMFINIFHYRMAKQLPETIF